MKNFMFMKETMSPYIDTHAWKNLYVLQTHIYGHIYMHIYMCVYVLSLFHAPIHTSIDLSRYFTTHNILKKIRQDQSITEI